MFFGGKTKRVVNFSKELADELYSAFPPAAVEKYRAGDRKAQRQFERAMDNAAVSLAQFRATHRLGIFTKAKFHQVFMERLHELGYEKAFAEEVNHYIMVKTP